MSLADPELSIRRFTVSELRRMKERGILPPQARIELLDGLLVDLPRPSARKIEVVRRLADLLAERLGAPVQGGEPIHPDAYATFDPNLMVHDWETLPLTAPYPLHRFSVEEYHRLGEIGILAAPGRYELLDGVVLEAAHRSPAQRLIDHVVDLLRERAGDAIVSVSDAVRLGPYSLPRPDVTVCHARQDRYRSGPPSGEDVVLAVDVWDGPSDVTHALRWPVYARWRIPIAWLIDPAGGAVHVGKEPSDRGYASTERYRSGETLSLPGPFHDVVLEVDDILG